MTCALVCTSCVAQSPVDRASGWLANAWKSVKKEGKAAADRVVKESPARFKELKSQVQTIAKTCENTIANLDLEGKQRVIEQLWRIRSSVNLLALTNPNSLSYVGVDPDQVTGMMSTVNTSWSNVSKRYPNLVRNLG